MKVKVLNKSLKYSLNFKQVNVSNSAKYHKSQRTCVSFCDCSEAEATINSLNGRWFAGRLIKAESYDQTAYEAEDFSG